MHQRGQKSSQLRIFYACPTNLDELPVFNYQNSFLRGAQADALRWPSAISHLKWYIKLAAFVDDSFALEVKS